MACPDDGKNSGERHQERMVSKVLVCGRDRHKLSDCCGKTLDEVTNRKSPLRGSKTTN
jgi:hypothetical protein